LQLLFQAEATERSVQEVLDDAYALSDDEPLDDFGRLLALGADEHRQEADSIIGRSSTNWTVERMPSVDRNLLRLAVYEMLYVDEVATAVTIDESVELAKAYGTDESSRFVNGLLGRVAQEIEGA
jgi:N utilization substance protein B